GPALSRKLFKPLTTSRGCHVITHAQAVAEIKYIVRRRSAATRGPMQRRCGGKRWERRRPMRTTPSLIIASMLLLLPLTGAVAQALHQKALQMRSNAAPRAAWDNSA